MRALDLSGERFGSLVVLERAPSVVRAQTKSAWLCACDCSEQVVALGGNLRSGNTSSCGCGRIHSKHGHARVHTRTYRSWYQMTSRCTSPTNDNYRYYGGRGIAVCDRWHGERGFENFLADMGERPAGKTLDRFPDRNGNYEPTNCRWATTREQGQNTRGTRLTAALAAECRQRRSNGEQLESIAKSIGVHKSTVQAVVAGRTWKNMPDREIARGRSRQDA